MSSTFSASRRDEWRREMRMRRAFILKAWIIPGLFWVISQIILVGLRKSPGWSPGWRPQGSDPGSARMQTVWFSRLRMRSFRALAWWSKVPLMLRQSLRHVVGRTLLLHFQGSMSKWSQQLYLELAALFGAGNVALFGAASGSVWSYKSAWFKTVGVENPKPVGVETLAGPELRNNSRSSENVVGVRMLCGDSPMEFDDFPNKNFSSGIFQPRFIYVWLREGVPSGKLT